MLSFIYRALIFVFCFGIGYFAVDSMRPKIAVLYIATGRYIIFWDGFYQSAEKNFLPNYKKHYFIFTDAETQKFGKNVTRIYRKQHAWPYDTLDRFDLFASIENQLKKYDYIYFLNANAEVVSMVGDEILPTIEQGITVAWHPGYYLEKDVDTYPYDRNSKSAAYIPYGKGKYYVQGGFNGGRTKDYLRLIHTLKEKTTLDKRNGIMARWHDESHLNKYILDKNPLVMPPNYIWARFSYEVEKIFKNNIKIVMRYKQSPEWGGTAWLRGKTNKKYKEITTEQTEKSYLCRNNHWSDYLVPEHDDYFCRREVPSECGTIEKKESRLIITWDNWPAETFIFDDKEKIYQSIKK